MREKITRFIRNFHRSKASLNENITGKNIIIRDAEVFSYHKIKDEISAAGSDLNPLFENGRLEDLALIAIEGSNTAAYWFTMEAELVYVNRKACESLGYSKEELLRLKISDFDPGWSKELVTEMVKKNPNLNKSVEFDTYHRRKDGILFPVRISAFFVNRGEENYIFTYAEDLTDLSEKSLRLKENERKMSFLASTAMELVEMKELDQIYEFLVDKLIQLTGESAIIILSDFDENGEYYTVRILKGLDSWVQKIIKILGYSPIGMKGRFDKHISEQLLTSGKLINLPVDIHTLSGKKVPKVAAKAISGIMNLQSIYSITLHNTAGLLANISILFGKNRDEMNIPLIESFTSQASVYIDKLLATKALEENRITLKNLIGNLQGVVYRCNEDDNRTMKFLNDEIRNLTGYKPEDLIDNNNVTFSELIYPDDRQMVLKSVQNALLSGERFTIEYRIVTKSGHLKWVVEKGLGIKDESGKFSQIEGFIADMTGIKENEEKISNQLAHIKKINHDLNLAKEKAEESDKLKSAFLANMSHEIRTPMNAILGFSGILGRKDLAEEKKERFILNITHSGEQLLRIIDDIIDISKIESNQLSLTYSSCNVDDSIQQVIDTIQNSKMKSLKSNVKIIFHKGSRPENPYMETDKTRFRQIMFNLLSNAIKFTSEGIIEVGYKVVYHELDSFLRFYVRDTGIGISREDQDIIFGRFTQAGNLAMKEGTGLGLSITRGIVEMMGGKIWLESELNKGSVFFFELPFKWDEKNSETRSDIKEDTVIDFSEKLIFIAEDDISSYLLLEEYLLETGAEIRHAMNGAELLELLNIKVPDLILLDINMPVLNGYETISRIRMDYPDIPVIAQTAYAMQEEKKMIIKAGCNDYISKPVKKNDLMCRIAKLI